MRTGQGPGGLAGPAAVAWRERHWIRTAISAAALLLVVLALFITGTLAALSTTSAAPAGFQPSQSAVADIPADFLQLYLTAGERYNIDWAVLAAIGKVETDHCRLKAPGVRSGANGAGAMGCMQFIAGTWQTYGQGGDVYDPAASIPAAARLLVASGAPGDYRRAIFAYNHADWYVAKVLDQAVKYRGALAAGGEPQEDAGAVAAILGNPRITLTPGQRADLQSGGLDPRLLRTLAWIGQHHAYTVTALRMDHAPGTNHEAGRAVDIGIVDGGVCRERWGAVNWHSTCSRLALQLARVTGPLRSTELIWCGDPDGPDPRGFARADHCDHVHVGWDG